MENYIVETRNLKKILSTGNEYGKGFGWSGFSGEGRRICSNYREIRKREKHIAAYDRRAGRAYKWECDCRR